MKSFAATVLCTTLAAAEIMTQMDYDFMKYISKFGKEYETVEEFLLRKEIFAEVHKHINEVNSDPTSTYKAGHNFLSDYTREEYQALLGLRNMPMPDFELDDDEEEIAENLPISWDWRDKGMVTPVKDQGQCGSCWAFSAIEAIESGWMINGNEMEIMSTQELVDCTTSVGNMGCSGGWYFQAYDWLKDHKTMRESDYPYIHM